MRPLLKTGLLCALLAGSTATRSAEACGGLFCSAANPVNQAAERIIFAQDGERVTAVIEIQYEGPSESFAWVLPIPGDETIDVGVSSKQALDALQQQSNPQYNLQNVFEDCGGDEDTSRSEGDFADDDAVGGDESPPSVEVIASGTVGPYDYVQLSVDDSLSEPADVAVNWLDENGYDVTNIGADLLGPYLEQGLDLIAFRLTKGNDAGAIRPVMLGYSAANPMIPIRPTAVAANDDMGVMVWVLGEARAIPANYLHLELNEAKINWFNASANYNDVVIAAADEAGGHGFVTEQAGDAATFSETIFPSWQEESFEQLSNGQFDSLESFFEQAVGFATIFPPPTFEGELLDGFLDVISDPEVVPLREGATPEQFVACVSCYFQENVPVRNDAYPETPYIPGEDPIEAMNVQAFLDALDEFVVAPLRDTQALFSEHAKVTRFYTTLSAAEMTEDPIFDFNPDLPDVSNIHTAERLFACDGTQHIALSQGVVIETDGVDWPIDVDDELPVNYRVLQLSTSGAGEVGSDNSERIGSMLVDLGIGTRGDLSAVMDQPGDDANGAVGDGGVSNESAVDGEGCGCRQVAAPRQSGFGWLAAGLFALALVRRRR